ncbi:unnamed protein product [Caenorhabditis angaria]|uniref:SCP domain-containing protein n=1 Tax=Caenorhabditis angaria TaxID=860376 RepID=A0A9P1NAI0_9PELO|nr:unnamed protein product [Caenorhabditis angaria]
MAMMKLSLFLFFFLIFYIAADTIEITVNQYTGLKRREIRGIENKFYQFQFCACPKKLTDRLVANNLQKCDCSGFERGKQLRESIGIAKLSNSVISKIANFDEETSRLLVKVLAGDRTLTWPDFQTIPMSNSKSEVLLTTLPNSKMRLAYTTNSIQKSTPGDNIPVMTNEKPKLSKLSTFFKTFRKSGAKKEEEPKQKYEVKAAPTPVTTFSSSLEINPEIRRLSNMNAVKSYLFSRSRVDKNEPVSYDVQSLKNMIVSYHNIYRSKHSALALSVDPVLESRGKRWADELAYHKGCLIHEQPRVYGENLFFFGARHLPNPKTLAQAVTQSFYLEGIGYNYSNWRPFSYFKTGHFTQLVWKKSTRIGVGISIVKANTVRSPCMSTSSNNMYLIWVVVKYDPAGNFESKNEYLDNVRPMTSSF